MVSDTLNSMNCGGALATAFYPSSAAYKVIKARGGEKKVLATIASLDTKQGLMSAWARVGLFGIKSIKKACFTDLK